MPAFIKCRHLFFVTWSLWAILDGFPIDCPNIQILYTCLAMHLNFLDMNHSLTSSALEAEIQEIEAHVPNVIEAAKKITALCRSRLWELRDHVVHKGFADEMEEIHFFKHTKQVPLVHLIYYSELLDLELKMAISGKKARRQWIKTKRKVWTSFLSGHAQFWKYMHLGHTHWDRQYFTRKEKDVLKPGYSHHIAMDPIFTTSHDMLLGQLRAYRRAIGYLRDRRNTQGSGTFRPRLPWSSTKAALTELVYALHHTGAINGYGPNACTSKTVHVQIKSWSIPSALS